MPPAAVDPTESLNNDDASNDRTPLLRATSNLEHTLSSTGSLTGEIHQRKSASNRASVPATYSGGSAELVEGISMDTMNDTSISEFTEWLDKQLAKIEGFYKEREDNMVQRFLLLQDQMFHLREDRMKMKSQGMPNKDELIKLGLAKTTKELTKLNKYDLPSLPKNPFKKYNEEAEITQHKSRDYERRKHAVPYYVARRQLKAAVQERYRELELLKSYRMLNRTGFRKLLKKFDKRLKTNLSATYMAKVDASHFASSDVLENMTPKIEDMYSMNFENGNRKVAVEKLRSNLREDHFYFTVFLTGLLYGIAIPLSIYALYLGLEKTISKEIPAGRYILQIWGGFFMLLLMASLFGVNCIVWHMYKINYTFIFEFNPKTALNYREFSLLPSLLFFFLSIFSWFSFNDFWPEVIPARFWPWFFVGVALVIMFLPYNILFLESRKWLLITMWRLMLSGFYPVEFRDFSLGDIFCSLTYTMGNISFFFCMYAINWKGAVEGNPGCGSSKSHLMGFFSTLPPIWRFLQCYRRYSDSGDWFPHLANMGKYSITIVYYATLSIYRIHLIPRDRAVFIFFAFVNSVFSGLWDLFMDWSLIQNKSLLRDDLIYPKWYYYFAMVSDITLRFQWVFYALFNRQVQQSAVTSFCIGVAEIIRRCIWLSIRMENEHVTNTHLYQAAREIPLPYDTVLRPIRSTPRVSEESAVTTGYSVAEGPADEEQQIPTTPSSRKSRPGISAGVLKNVSMAIVNAHAKDFQRRKSNVDEIAENSSEEDNSDDEG